MFVYLRGRRLRRRRWDIRCSICGVLVCIFFFLGKGEGDRGGDGEKGEIGERRKEKKEVTYVKTASQALHRQL